MRRGEVCVGSRVETALMICVKSRSASGHFETNSNAYRCASIGLILLQELTFWRWGSKVGAVGSCTSSRRPHRRSGRAITLSTSSIAKLRAADDERRQAKRNSLADRLVVEVLTNLKVEKAVVDGERRKVEADLGPVRYLASLLGADDQDVLRWFILVIAVPLDPAAVLLLLAATRVGPLSSAAAGGGALPKSQGRAIGKQAGKASALRVIGLSSKGSGGVRCSLISPTHKTTSATATRSCTERPLIEVNCVAWPIRG
jgi:hypothetical protein